MAGSILKGALISFIPAGGPLSLPDLPSVIVFQINPETITHAWTAAAAPQPPPSDPKGHVNALAVTGDPGETFSFTLMMDANEEVANAASDPVSAGLALASGLYSRLAALELLQFPTTPPSAGLVGAVSAAASAAASVGGGGADAQNQSVPTSQVPVVLFVWGPLRIVPVRVTAFSVVERLFDELLNPTHAEATITLTVLTEQDLATVSGTLGSLAQAAYRYTQGVRQVGAAANVVASASSILGMLPSPF
jgi:hypothetical protein